MAFEAAYRRLHRNGVLAARAAQAREHERACDLCARYCRVDRSERVGGCRTGLRPRLASFGAHHGEEDPLRGWHGSGTIFFAWCNLRCQYCQNHDISQTAAGPEVGREELATAMLSLQAAGCHNINFVSPSHVIAPILEALDLACARGLQLPIVFNTGGYDSPEALALLDGVIDIYMPDMKYSAAATARRLSKVSNYPEANRVAVTEMHRQVGDLVLDKDGIAQRGLLVRHLILPEGLAGTREVVRFLAEEISPNTYLNLMAQYRPAFRAHEHPPLDRPITAAEYDEAVEMAQAAGLTRLDGRWRKAVGQGSD
jgi:putative pyruvate formate lyase activating enzyme